MAYAAEVDTTFNFPTCLRFFNVITRSIGKTIWRNYVAHVREHDWISWYITSPMLLIDCLIILRRVISQWRYMFLIWTQMNRVHT